VNGVRVGTPSEFISALSIAGFSTVTFELLQAEGGVQRWLRELIGLGLR
jgi:hypothetical protein